MARYQIRKVRAVRCVGILPMSHTAGLLPGRGGIGAGAPQARQLMPVWPRNRIPEGR